MSCETLEKPFAQGICRLCPCLLTCQGDLSVLPVPDTLLMPMQADGHNEETRIYSSSGSPHQASPLRQRSCHQPFGNSKGQAGVGEGLLLPPRRIKASNAEASTATEPTPNAVGVDASALEALILQWREGEALPHPLLPLDIGREVASSSGAGGGRLDLRNLRSCGVGFLLHAHQPALA